MDPDATLATIREIVREMLHGDPTHDRRDDLAERLAEYTEALDEWMSKGGLMPRAWITAGDHYV